MKARYTSHESTEQGLAQPRSGAPARVAPFIASATQASRAPERPVFEKAKSLANPLTTLLAWVYVYLIGLLGLWVLLATLFTGWSPVVITSGSMQPTLRPGDVVLLGDDLAEQIAQSSVITFELSEDPDELVTHRVHSVEADGYVTKGDANPTPDTDLVDPASVRGVGRLVVPLVGLPIAWFGDGNHLALGGWLIVSIGAVAVAASSARRGWRRRDGFEGRHTQLTGKAVRRVRVLVGAMIAMQYLIDPERFEIDGGSFARWQVMVAVLTMVVGINAVSFAAARSGDAARMSRTSIVELISDTALVVLLTSATGTAGIGWVLFALPIIEAAARYRLVGALMHWMALTALALVSRVWILERYGSGSVGLIKELDGMVDQLSVLLLVIIPGAYLIEQLSSDILLHRSATDEAVERGRMLQHVAETSREVNRLGAEVFDTITAAVLSLGFDGTDVAAKLPDTEWNILASAGLRAEAIPLAGVPGSALRTGDLEEREVWIGPDDPDPDDAVAIGVVGADLLARVTLSDRDGTTIALRAMATSASSLRSGAVEALRLLAGQATVALQNERLLSELQGVHDEMAHQAKHDSLTGLPNRAYFLGHLEAELAAANDPARRHAVLFMDLDGFKGVNDRLGHEAGDRLLEAVAKRLVNVADRQGLVARLGGDEFTILLEPVETLGHAESAARRVQESLTEPFRVGPEMVSIGTSIGTALAEAGVSGSELLRRADAAMYAAKSQIEKVPHVIYHAALDASDRRRARMADDFNKALAGNELELHYQPILQAGTGQILGVEALLRWTHREHGPVNTASILELSEVCGQTVALNRWILRRAADDTTSWRIPTDRDFFVAVNVSAAELSSDDLLANITDTLELSGIPAHNLVIELSERIVATSPATTTNLERLAGLGVRLALDDFGQGKTSLAHLRSLPINMLKIDRLLVQNSVRSERDRIILGSVATLGHELGFEVVAEGVETVAQRELVVGAGVDLMQGYLMYRPMKAPRIAVLMKPRAAAGTPTRETHIGIGNSMGRGVR